MEHCILSSAAEIQDRSGNRAVGFAAEALRQDLRRKLGVEGSIRPDSGESGWIELRLDPSDDSFDRHTIQVRPEGISITGSDELGLIHGIYAFSQRWLDADPCHYFTEIVPERAEKVGIRCGTEQSKPYTFRHRGFFFNDEDLLVGFQMESPEHGFSMEVWRHLFELALRMKCTCVIPGTNILADEPQVKLASDMGLYIAQHHAEPVGAAPFFWPRGIPFSWSTNREQMIEWWRKAIERQVGRKVLWTLNFRGLLDRPFWADDPNMSPDAPLEKKAKIINEALQTQYELIREIRGEESPETYGYLWGELSRLYKAGLLRFPEGTTIIHSDGANGVMAGNLESLAEESPYPTGVYQHISMFTGSQSMRVISFSPRIYAREMKRVVDMGMNRIFILNVANVREKIFNLRQVMGYANDYETMAEISGPDGRGYFDWYVQNVLNTQAAEVADSYRALIEIPFPFDENNPDNVVGDNIYTNIVRYTLQRIYNREDSPPSIWALQSFQSLTEAIEWFIKKLSETEPQWHVAFERAQDAAKHLEGNQRRFYENEAGAQIEKSLHLTRMALAFCRSVRYYLEGEGYEAYLEAYQALRHVRSAVDLEERIETGKFKGWHRNDLNCRTWKCRDFLSTWHSMLDDQRWMNLDGLAEGPQPCYAAYKYNPNFKTAYRPDLHLQPEK